MKTAVCDDDRLAAKQLVKMIEQCPLYKDTEPDVYDDFKLLLQNVQKGKHYDIVFMDIEWNQEKTGIDFSSDLFQADMETTIVFVTGYAEFSQDVFLKKINLGGFLIKPVNQEKLNSLSEILEKKRVQFRAKVFEVLSDRTATRISIGQILYIESDLHQCLIHTNREKIRCSEKLMELMKRLPANFQQCHKSYLVNMDRIYKLEGNKVFLDNGECLPISRSQSKTFAEAFFMYIGKKDG